MLLSRGTKTAVAYHEGWITGFENDPYGTNWIVSTDFKGNYRSNGVSRGSTTDASNGLPSLSINDGNNPFERSDFEVADVLIFSRTLPLQVTQKIESYLMKIYGIDYIKWLPNQPDNYLNIEDCAHIYSIDTGSFNDQPW